MADLGKEGAGVGSSISSASFPGSLVETSSPAGPRRPWRQLRVCLLLVPGREEGGRQAPNPALWGIQPLDNHHEFARGAEQDSPVSLALWSLARGKQGDICSRRLQRVFSGV